jgi:hypothetical protein
MHSTSSKRQLVQGAPCSTTLHLTFRALQHWHALEALRFTGLPFVAFVLAEAPTLGLGEEGGLSEAAGEKLSSFIATVSDAIYHKSNLVIGRA